MPNRGLTFQTMSADDFEELILDMPADEKWELIGGRVIRGMVGASWERLDALRGLGAEISAVCGATTSGNHRRTGCAGAVRRLPL